MKKNPLLPLTLLALFTLAGVSLKRTTPGNGWDADAGLIPSFAEDATVTTTSNQAEAAKILDGDPSTAWQSEAPLPQAFIARPDLNIFLGKASGFVDCPGCNMDAGKMMDGDLNSASQVRIDGKGGLTLDLGKNQQIFSVSMKCQVKSPIEILYVDEKHNPVSLGFYDPADNFQLKRWEVPGSRAKFIAINATASFALFEIAALAGPPVESAVFDLGETRPVGTIHARHWAGENAAISTKIFLSTDRKNWQEVATPDPHSTQVLISAVEPEMPARYLKVEHTLHARDWNKVFLWEVKAYDRFGHFGPRPSASQGHTKIGEMLGVNGYWSWGTDQYSDQLAPDGGPYRYRPVASHARNYHDMTWDLRSPDTPIDFEKMASGGGTPAKEWLNWDREYAAWLDAGLNVQSSLQFYRFEPKDWQQPRQSAFEYARAFTRHFGPKNGNGYVCTIEAGNEPWHYPAEVYREILLGMAEGAAAGDPGVEVFPCALQAADPTVEKNGFFKNYMGARITPEAARLLDGINIHAYSYVTDGQGKRLAVHPEHPNSTFWEILNAIRWRDRNMPGKKIYLSEWGWDCGGGGETCTHDECVSEGAAAGYAVRAALIAARLGFERATWFYYGNDKSGSSLYTRSGLTGSANSGFKKKQVFFALQSLVENAGGSYFHSVVREDETAWMYLLADQRGRVTHLVAWLPVDGDSTLKKNVKWKTEYSPVSAIRLDGISKKQSIEKSNGEINLELSATPMLIKLE